MTDGGERTPLMRAAMFNRAEVIARLAKAGAKLNAPSIRDRGAHGGPPIMSRRSRRWPPPGRT